MRMDFMINYILQTIEDKDEPEVIPTDEEFIELEQKAEETADKIFGKDE